MKTITKLGLISSLLLFSTCSYAQLGNFLISAYAGASYNYLNPGLLTEPLVGDGHDKSVPIESSEFNFMPGFGIAYNLPFPQCVAKWLSSYSLGLDMFFLNRGQTGAVYENDQTDGNNYFYNLRVNTTRLMFDGQINFAPLLHSVFPFITAGLGGARIKTTYYQSPNLNEGITDGQIDLGTHTQNNFVYTVGAGLSIPLTTHFIGSVGYQFTDFGHTKTSNYSAPQDSVVNPIDSRLYSNAMYVKLSYSF